MTEEITKVILKLPHSKVRVPYTYHHDFLRQNYGPASGMSRSDVARQFKHNPTILYACALSQILDNLGHKAFHYLTPEDYSICTNAVDIAKSFVSN